MSRGGNVPRLRAKRLEWTACAVLLSLHTVLLAWGAYRHSPVIDEWGHLPAGLMHWREGRFDAYRVNPPLVRMVATLPLLGWAPDTTWILLLVLWPVLWLAARWTRRGDAAPLVRESIRFAAILVIATYVVNAMFEFQGSFTRLGDYQFVSKALRGPEGTTKKAYEGVVGNRFAGTLLGACPLPFPRDYVLGIDLTRSARRA